MSQPIPPCVETLFACSSQQGKRLTFEWRMIQRKGRPFLLVPTTVASPRASLKLYAAQHWEARALGKVFPMLVRSPAARLREIVKLEVNADSELIQFLARQSGVPVEHLPAPAIKLGGSDSHQSRLVLLLVDALGGPSQVVKVGLDAAGRAATDHEADFLAQMPAGLPGGISLAGRLKTPFLRAFATNYLPGESPSNDAGFEDLFNSWLNREELMPVQTTDYWRKLEALAKNDEPLGRALAVVRTALGGTKIHSTWYHGDFAPWNLRAVHSQVRHAYEWERGSRRGIPGWDWFHFIIQTAILAQRLPVERAAGEVEQLLASPRFQAYAENAGISKITRPLVLGYLLHQLWVVNPAEGWHLTGELYTLLSARWGLQPEVARLFQPPARPTSALGQLQTAAGWLRNAFWEPRLNSQPSPPLKTQVIRHWQLVVTSVLLLVLAGGVQAQLTKPVSFLPFYLAPCLLLTWFTNRRLGMWLVTLATVIGPGITYARIPGYDQGDIVMWNLLMRLVILQMGVLLIDKIRRGKDSASAPHGHPQPVRLKDGWAVLLASILWLGGTAWLNYVTPPQMDFLPLYLLPCVALTLTFGLRWGVMAALASTLCASTKEFHTGPLSSFVAADNWNFYWNFCVHFGIALLILVYLDKFRKGSILFYSGHHLPSADEMTSPAALR